VADELRYEKSEHVAVLTLNRPESLNSLSPTLMQALRERLDEINADADVRVAIITGAGDKAFSAGFDLAGGELPDRTDEFRNQIRANFDTFMRIWNLRVPTISAVNGYAIAAGSNIAMACDITVASEQAKFGEPELRHFALSPLMLLPWFNGNPRMVHYLYYSGDTIDAKTALELGLVAKVVPHEQVLEEALRMAHRIAKVAPYAVQVTKDSIRQTYEIMGFTNAMRYHFVNDLTVLGASGIPEKDELQGLMRSGDMKAFLTLRDGPFKN
jgi:enoyl-CoA hydratase/carnithine racemase